MLCVFVRHRVLTGSTRRILPWFQKCRKCRKCRNPRGVFFRALSENVENVGIFGVFWFLLCVFARHRVLIGPTRRTLPWFQKCRKCRKCRNTRGVFFWVVSKDVENVGILGVFGVFCFVFVRYRILLRASVEIRLEEQDGAETRRKVSYLKRQNPVLNLHFFGWSSGGNHIG